MSNEIVFCRLERSPIIHVREWCVATKWSNSKSFYGEHILMASVIDKINNVHFYQLEKSLVLQGKWVPYTRKWLKGCSSPPWYHKNTFPSWRSEWEGTAFIAKINPTNASPNTFKTVQRNFPLWCAYLLKAELLYLAPDSSMQPERQWECPIKIKN